jgi:hypothetical protein
MKNRKALVLAVIVPAMLLAGCDFFSSLFQDPIVGTWNATAITYNGTPITLDASTYYTSTINNDDTWSGSGKGGGTESAASGTWSKSDGTYSFSVTTISMSGASVTSWIATLSSDHKTMYATVTGIVGSQVFTETIISTKKQ